MIKSMKKSKQAKERKYNMPDTYVIIFFVVLFAAILTYFIPQGKFDVSYKVYDSSNRIIAEVADGGSYNFQINVKSAILQDLKLNRRRQASIPER